MTKSAKTLERAGLQVLGTNAKGQTICKFPAARFIGPERADGLGFLDGIVADVIEDIEQNDDRGG